MNANFAMCATRGCTPTSQLVSPNKSFYTLAAFLRYLVMETRKVNKAGSSLKAPECCLHLSHVFSYMYGIKEDHENSIILL